MIEKNGCINIDINEKVISFLNRMSSEYPIVKDNDPVEPDNLGLVFEEISINPETGKSLDELSHSSCLSKYAFIRKYSKRYGLTPHADIMNRRIQKAIRLLDSDLPLTDIALECGFSDQSHFNKQFKLYTGNLPSQYRKAILYNT